MSARRRLKVKPARLSPLSDEGEEQLSEIIYEAFESDDGRTYLENKIRELERQADNNDLETIKACVQSLWSLFEGVRLIKNNESYEEAARRFQRCADDFERFNLEELKHLSMSLGMYTSAIGELRMNNYGKALTMLEDVKKYVKEAGEFGSSFAMMVDLFEPEILFMNGIQAINRLDYRTGETYFIKASQAAEHVANQYYKDDELLFNTYWGYGLYCKAYSSYVVAYDKFRRYEFDNLSSNKDLASIADQAKATLEKGDTQLFNVKTQILLSEAMGHILVAISKLADMMQKVLNSTFKADVKNFKHIKQEISTARQSAAKIGPDAVVFVTSCDHLYSVVNNLERLAKPNKKDFGIFSGLISAALFFPLFFVISWANANFATGIDPSMIIYPSVILALIGGFGFGALKFASLLSPFQSKKDDG